VSHIAAGNVAFGAAPEPGVNGRIAEMTFQQQVTQVGQWVKVHVADIAFL